MFHTIDSINQSIPAKNITEHCLVIKTTAEYLEVLLPFLDNVQSKNDELAQLFQVSEVTLLKEVGNFKMPDDCRDISVVVEENGSSKPIATVYVTKAKFALCPRCRRFVSLKPGQPCEQCIEVLARQYK